MAILQNDGREQTSLILVKCGGSPRNLPPNPNKAKTEVDISDKHLKQTRDHIEKQIKNVIARKFAARPRSQRKTCDGCDYKRICCEKEFDVKIDFKKD